MKWSLKYELKTFRYKMLSKWRSIHFKKWREQCNSPPSTTRTLQSLCKTTMPVIYNWFAFISTLNFFAGFDRFRTLLTHTIAQTLLLKWSILIITHCMLVTEWCKDDFTNHQESLKYDLLLYKNFSKDHDQDTYR